VLLALLLAQDSGPPPRIPNDAVTERCGSLVRWETDLAAALARATREKRPVFWYVNEIAGSPMDRRQVLDNYMRAGPFSQPDVMDLLERRFVALRAPAEEDVQERYDVRAFKLIEPGFLVLVPDGRELCRVDRIATFSEEWMVHALREALKKAPGLSRAEGKDAAGLLRDGEPERALESVAGEGPERRYLEGRILRRLRRAEDARKALEAAGTADARVELAVLALREGKPAEALGVLDGLLRRGDLRFSRAAEAHWLYGVALRLLGRDADAEGVWRKLATAMPESPWAWKAHAEAIGAGPFSRGFELVAWVPAEALLPAPATTRRPRKPEEARAQAEAAVAFLLARQRGSGAWDDSNYDFGGLDSLPNVHAAVTALAAIALLRWRDAGPAPAVDEALARAWRFLADERNTAPKDRDELAWAHVYRLLLGDAWLEADPARAAAIRPKLAEWAGLLAKCRSRKGVFHHEYANPFVTAASLLALDAAKRRGVAVDGDVIEAGVEALRACRSEAGTWSYLYPGGRRATAPQASIGRGPICELALLVHGASKPERVLESVRSAVEHHEVFETVRQYDDHADRWRNGGFFFWFGMHGRALAIARVPEPERPALARRLVETVMAIPEIDGTWVDSHELGKSYGTAMGLLVLKACLELAQ